jgi:VIT1/CCC1 family predicted Fe2+/Mn2+ transporter
MRDSIKTGFSFGLTSGIITTLGLMVGLTSGTNSKLAVIGGILTIAIADAFSDALGIHISEEAENKHSEKEIWESTVSTFLFKFITAITFIIPVIMLDLSTSVIVSIIWGLSLLGVFSYHIARSKNVNPYIVIAEHILIGLVVIVASHYAGSLIKSAFG